MVTGMKISTIIKIIKLLEKKYPTEWFRHEDPFRVLISTVLSQRTKDENTERASKLLFSQYKNVGQLAKADLREIQKLIKIVGFYKQKAKNIKKISQILIKQHGGKVPKNFDALISLPGVGRKTANCVLVYGYKIPAIPVDVHVHVISNRLGIVKTKDPEHTEKELTKIIPKRYWIRLNELFVRHGQEVCKAKPLCRECVVNNFCDYYRKVFIKP